MFRKRKTAKPIPLDIEELYVRSKCNWLQVNNLSKDEDRKQQVSETVPLVLPSLLVTNKEDSLSHEQAAAAMETNTLNERRHHNYGQMLTCCMMMNVCKSHWSPKDDSRLCNSEKVNQIESGKREKRQLYFSSFNHKSNRSENDKKNEQNSSNEVLKQQLTFLSEGIQSSAKAHCPPSIACNSNKKNKLASKHDDMMYDKWISSRKERYSAREKVDDESENSDELSFEDEMFKIMEKKGRVPSDLRDKHLARQIRSFEKPQKEETKKDAQERETRKSIFCVHRINEFLNSLPRIFSQCTPSQVEAYKKIIGTTEHGDSATGNSKHVSSGRTMHKHKHGRSNKTKPESLIVQEDKTVLQFHESNQVSYIQKNKTNYKLATEGKRTHHTKNPKDFHYKQSFLSFEQQKETRNVESGNLQKFNNHKKVATQKSKFSQSKLQKPSDYFNQMKVQEKAEGVQAYKNNAINIYPLEIRKGDLSPQNSKQEPVEIDSLKHSPSSENQQKSYPQGNLVLHEKLENENNKNTECVPSAGNNQSLPQDPDPQVKPENGETVKAESTEDRGSSMFNTINVENNHLLESRANNVENNTTDFFTFPELKVKTILMMESKTEAFKSNERKVTNSNLWMDSSNFFQDDSNVGDTMTTVSVVNGKKRNEIPKSYRPTKKCGFKSKLLHIFSSKWKLERCMKSAQNDLFNVKSRNSFNNNNLNKDKDSYTLDKRTKPVRCLKSRNKKPNIQSRGFEIKEQSGKNENFNKLSTGRNVTSNKAQNGKSSNSDSHTSEIDNRGIQMEHLNNVLNLRDYLNSIIQNKDKLFPSLFSEFNKSPNTIPLLPENTSSKLKAKLKGSNDEQLQRLLTMLLNFHNQIEFSENSTNALKQENTPSQDNPGEIKSDSPDIVANTSPEPEVISDSSSAMTTLEGSQESSSSGSNMSETSNEKTSTSNEASTNTNDPGQGSASALLLDAQSRSDSFVSAPNVSPRSESITIKEVQNEDESSEKQNGGSSTASPENTKEVALLENKEEQKPSDQNATSLEKVHLNSNSASSQKIRKSSSSVGPQNRPASGSLQKSPDKFQKSSSSLGSRKSNSVAVKKPVGSDKAIKSASTNSQKLLGNKISANKGTGLVVRPPSCLPLKPSKKESPSSSIRTKDKVPQTTSCVHDCFRPSSTANTKRCPCKLKRVTTNNSFQRKNDTQECSLKKCTCIKMGRTSCTCSPGGKANNKDVNKRQQSQRGSENSRQTSKCNNKKTETENFQAKQCGCGTLDTASKQKENEQSVNECKTKSSDNPGKQCSCSKVDKSQTEVKDRDSKQSITRESNNKILTEGRPKSTTCVNTNSTCKAISTSSTDLQRSAPPSQNIKKTFCKCSQNGANCKCGDRKRPVPGKLVRQSIKIESKSLSKCKCGEKNTCGINKQKCQLGADAHSKGKDESVNVSGRGGRGTDARESFDIKKYEVISTGEQEENGELKSNKPMEDKEGMPDEQEE
ncbi:hypothetical protein C0J52_12603, partial [Blattella germanica]